MLFLMNITLPSSIDITKYICFLISEKVGEHGILLGASGKTRIIDTQLYFFNKNIIKTVQCNVKLSYTHF